MNVKKCDPFTDPRSLCSAAGFVLYPVAHCTCKGKTPDSLKEI